IKSVGSEGNGEAQFNSPRGLDVSDRNSNVYVCVSSNNRVQILTQEFKFHSTLGIDLFRYPHDVKVTRDRVLVLDDSDPYRDYNIIMSDYNNHCVYVFNQEGEQIHKFGKEGQGIGEFYCPWGIALDNTGHIIVVCDKNTNCLQFF
ncbi:Tripartite motif-containing protein 2-like, partial [Oopsacas minuta]